MHVYIQTLNIAIHMYTNLSQSTITITCTIQTYACTTSVIYIE